MDNPAQIFEVTPEAFQSEVIERSSQAPVVLLFWAAQMAPAADAQRVLSALVPRYQGKVFLGLVDVAQDQTLAQHLRVQGLPSIRVVQNGQIAAQLDGPQTESAYTEMLDSLTMSSADALRAQLALLLEQKQFDAALNLLQQAIAEEPNNQAFRVELADVLLRQATTGNEQALGDARQLLAAIPEDTEDRKRPQTRLDFLEEAADFEPVAVLNDKLAQDPDDLEVRYQLAVRLAGLDGFEAALEHALHILQSDRKFRDDIGRLTMIRIFDLMGKGSPLASSYRRRMFNFLH